MVPSISPWLWSVFGRYARRYVRRHFHAVRLCRAGGTPTQPPDLPLIVYINHASWWDPMIGLFLAQRYWPNRRHYAPMDAASLTRYRFFSRLGFFGVEQNSPRGAASFLRTASLILEQPDAVLWVTPQSAFADPRCRPLSLRPGLGHLIHRLPRCAILPLAFEYPFWQERFPEALVHCGQPIDRDGDHSRSPQQWTDLLTRSLEQTQDQLAAAAMTQDTQQFEILLGGRAGVGGTYDLWRRLRSLLIGQKFQPEHGAHQP